MDTKRETQFMSLHEEFAGYKALICHERQYSTAKPVRFGNPQLMHSDRVAKGQALPGRLGRAGARDAKALSKTRESLMSNTATTMPEKTRRGGRPSAKMVIDQRNRRKTPLIGHEK